MPRRTKAEREADAREKLITTLVSIYETDPIMGGKWREGMLKYYSQTLAKLMLWQRGSDNPEKIVIELLASELLDNLGC